MGTVGDLLTWNDGRLLRCVQPPVVVETRWGLRVPSMVISPWAKPRFIDRPDVVVRRVPQVVEDRSQAAPGSTRRPMAGRTRVPRSGRTWRCWATWRTASTSARMRSAADPGPVAAEIACAANRRRVLAGPPGLEPTTTSERSRFRFPTDHQTRQNISAGAHPVARRATRWARTRMQRVGQIDHLRAGGTSVEMSSRYRERRGP